MVLQRHLATSGACDTSLSAVLTLCASRSVWMRRGFFIAKPVQGPNITPFCAVDRNLPKEAFSNVGPAVDLQAVAAPSLTAPSFDQARLPGAFRDSSVYVKSADGKEENILVLLHGRGDTPKPYAQLARKMELPQTSALAIAGPLDVPFTENGKAWFQVSAIVGTVGSDLAAAGLVFARFECARSLAQPCSSPVGALLRAWHARYRLERLSHACCAQAFDDDFAVIPGAELETRRASSLDGAPHGSPSLLRI